MPSKYKDSCGTPLMDGVYFAGDGGLSGDLYMIQVKTDGTFSAENYIDGKVLLSDSEEFAKHLTPLNNPKSNLEFILSKL